MVSRYFVRAAIVLLVAQFGSKASANLLTDPGFELNPLNPSYSNLLNNFPAYQGQWAAESGQIVGLTNGITPLAGRNQLELFGPNTGTASQSFQEFDVTAYAALIDAGLAVVQAGSYQNSDAPAAAGSVSVSYYTGNSLATATTYSLAGLTLDNSLSTWELDSLSAPIPAGTRWLVFQSSFDANSITGVNSSGVSTAGFVDEAYVNIAAVPEPASLAVIGIPVALSLLRRRRTNQRN